MTTIVTGGSGMVGRNLQELCPNWIYLSSKDCDLTNETAVKYMFEQYQPDYVIHLAAAVGGLYKNMNDNYEMMNKNLMINSNIIKYCRIFKVKRLIACLSTCIFPNEVQYPITEEQLHNGPPHPSNEGYSYAKRLLEVQCRLSGIEYVCLVPTNLYGKYDNFNLEDAHVLPNLIHKCYLAKRNNNEFVIKGSGIAQRQFLYALDFAKIIKHVVFSDETNYSMICTPPETDEVSIKYCVEQISRFMNYQNIVYDISYSDGQLKKTVSNKTLLKTIPNFEYTTFSDGLRDTIEWFNKNYETVRK